MSRIDLDMVNEVFEQHYGRPLIEEVENKPVRDPDKSLEDAQDIVVEQEERYRELRDGGMKDTLTGEVVDPFTDDVNDDDYQERFPR